MFQKKFPQVIVRGRTGAVVRTRGPCRDGRSQVIRPCQRWQSEPPSTVTAVYHEVFLHGPVAAHCMIVLKPEVPRCRLNWSFSCTVNAPSMIPAINIVVATTWRSDMGSHSDNTLPRPRQIEPFKMGFVCSGVYTLNRALSPFARGRVYMHL